MLESEAEEAGEQSTREEEALKNCLTKLPGKQRTLVESAYGRGVRIDQMAEEIGRTPMSLYKALHRIRMSLADCIEQFLQKEEQPG